MIVAEEKGIDPDKWVHHGLVKAVNEAFPDVCVDGRIWYKDMRNEQ